MKPRSGGLVAAAHAIEDFDDWSDVDVESRFLAHLASHRDVESLAQFHGTAGNAPLAFQRLLASANQQNAVAIEHDGADADDRTRRKFPI